MMPSGPTTSGLASRWIQEGLCRAVVNGSRRALKSAQRAALLGEEDDEDEEDEEEAFLCAQNLLFK